MSATEVHFAEVGDLYSFGSVARLRPAASVIATTIHGPGYGLDEREAFLSLLRGWMDCDPDAVTFDRLIVVERDGARASRLRGTLNRVSAVPSLIDVPVAGLPRRAITKPAQTDCKQETGGEDKFKLSGRAPRVHIEYGRDAQVEPRKLFVAIPFADRHRDAFDISFAEAAHRNGFICERLDLESYTGDVIAEMQRRIRDAAGVIALLDNAMNRAGFAGG